MPKLFELKQQHTALLDKADALVKTAETEKRSMTATEQELADLHLKGAEALTKQIRASEGRNTLRANSQGFFGLGASEASLPSVAPRNAPTTFKEAVKGASSAEVDELRSFATYLGGDMTALADLRPSGNGGVFIPSIVVGVIGRNYSAFTPVRTVSTVWPTEGGEPAVYPVISDSEVAVILAPADFTGADAIVSGNTPPTALTGPEMGAYKFSSRPIFVPREILSDSNLNVLEEMFSALLARIARTQNLKYTKGSGSGEPTGFLQTATGYSAGSVPLDLDIALDLAYTVPALYRPQGVYMCSDLTVKYLRKLKTGISGDKRSLWKDAFEEGNATLNAPARLHGYDLITNNDMDSVAADGTFAGVSPLVFGDFKRFIIREAEQGAPFSYRYDVPASDGSAVIVFARSDSKLVVPTAISKLTV